MKSNQIPFRIQSLEDYQRSYDYSVQDPEGFWTDIAQSYHWRKKWDKTLEWEFNSPSVKWFLNGELNITENCLDRHIAEKGNQTALIWEPNDPSEASLHFTYIQLLAEVNRMANVLKSIGVQKGDRVCIYLPMIPELAFATLACARIGAIHSVVFAGFSSNAVADRINDSNCAFVIKIGRAHV
jgi:acetyl-CoA synthetase